MSSSRSLQYVNITKHNERMKIEYIFVNETYLYWASPLDSVDCCILIFSYNKASSSFLLISCVPRMSLSFTTISTNHERIPLKNSYNKKSVSNFNLDILFFHLSNAFSLGFINDVI